MMKWTKVLFVLCLNDVVSGHMHSFYESDYMGREDKQKLLNLALELVKDSRIKIRQVLAIQHFHQSRISYDVGIVIGKIRERYRRMMDIYREVGDRVHKRATIMAPSLWWHKPFHIITFLELVRSIETDIDKMVEILEVVPFSVYKAERDSVHGGIATTPALGWADAMAPVTEFYTQEITPAPTTPPPPPKKKGRMGDTAEYDTSDDSNPVQFKNEQALKSYYKNNFEKKEGHDHTWNLDHYYGID